MDTNVPTSSSQVEKRTPAPGHSISFSGLVAHFSGSILPLDPSRLQSSQDECEAAAVPYQNDNWHGINISGLNTVISRPEVFQAPTVPRRQYRAGFWEYYVQARSKLSPDQVEILRKIRETREKEISRRDQEMAQARAAALQLASRAEAGRPVPPPPDPKPRATNKRAQALLEFARSRGIEFSAKILSEICDRAAAPSPSRSPQPALSPTRDGDGVPAVSREKAYSPSGRFDPITDEDDSPIRGALALKAVPLSPESNPDQVADYRRFRAKVVGRRLMKAAFQANNIFAWRVAKLLLDCGSLENLWVADDLMNDEGELRRGTGGLTRCNRKFCVTCSADQRRRARARIRAGLENLYPQRGELWRFVTLTSPTLEGVDIIPAIKVFQRAWALLRNRPFWREIVRAGAKGIEFTVNRIGFHVHIHALVLAKWIPQEQLKTEWTECVLYAWKEAGFSAPINTADGKLIVDVRLVRPRNSKVHGRQISRDAAINEVCKYLTKSCSWDSVPNTQLVNIASVRRWPRMVEVLGEARAAAAATSLDTPRLSDSENLDPQPANPPLKNHKGRAPPLLDLPLDLEPEKWVRIMKARRGRQRAFRKIQLAEKYPSATFCLLNDDIWDFASVQEMKRLGDSWRHAKREIGKNVSFIDGSHCPKCAARLISFQCPFCFITVDRSGRLVP